MNIQSNDFNHEDALSSVETDIGTITNTNIGNDDIENILAEPRAEPEPGTENLKTKRQNKRADKEGKTRRTQRRKTETVASLNEAIEKQKQFIKNEESTLQVLITKRNELYVAESEGLGLMQIIADPQKASLLASLLQQAR